MGGGGSYYTQSGQLASDEVTHKPQRHEGVTRSRGRRVPGGANSGDQGPGAHIQRHTSLQTWMELKKFYK